MRARTWALSGLAALLAAIVGVVAWLAVTLVFPAGHTRGAYGCSGYDRHLHLPVVHLIIWWG